jgi:3-dehydrosphinganine reductase
MPLGLADTLQSELILYGVDVQIFFPNTMFTSGYDEENKTKPAIVKKIEEGDEGVTADQAALTLLKGLESGHAHISGDIITNLFRACTRGAAYRSNWLLDGLLDFVAYVRCF